MVNILFCTSDYRGDHSADVEIAIEPVEGETVDQLIKRAGLTYGDCLKIRVTRPEK